MTSDSNLNKFDQLHEALKSLEQEESRFQFLFNMAYSYLESEQKDFIKTLKNLEIDATQWNVISNLFDGIQNGLILGQRTFTSDDIDNPLHELGFGYQSIDVLVASLYFSNQWPDVCYQYAKILGENPSYGAGDIIKDYEKQLGTEYHL